MPWRAIAALLRVLRIYGIIKAMQTRLALRLRQSNRTLPPPHICIVYSLPAAVPRVEEGEAPRLAIPMARALLEGDNPSTRKRGFSPSKPPTFPSTAWGCRPKTLRFFSHSAFLGFARVRIVSPVCFLASRACARLSRCVFWLRAFARGFPGVFFGFARVREASPARFFASRVCARLSRRVFWLRAFA